MMSTQARKTGPRLAILGAAFGLLFLLLAPAVLGGTPTVGPPGAPWESSKPAIAAAAVAGERGAVVPASGPGAVIATLSLVNDSAGFGNLASINGLSPTAMAYDSVDQRIFVAVSLPAPGLLIVDPTTGTSLALVPFHWSSGAIPSGVAYDALDGRVFVTGGAADNVTRLDAHTGAVLGATGLASGSHPTAIAFDPPDDRIYFTEPTANVVGFMNASSGAFLGTVPVGSGPAALGYDPFQQRMIVANRGGNTVTEIDPSNGSNDRTVAVGLGPAGVSYSPDQATVLVTNSLSNNVTVLNKTTLRSLRSYGAGAEPIGIVVSSTGIAYVANHRSGNITVVDDSSATRLPSVAAGFDPIAVVWDSTDGHAFVANALSDNITVIAEPSHAFAASIPIGSAPGGLASVPGTGAFVVANTNAANLTFLNAGNGSFLGAGRVPGLPMELTTDPLGTRLFVTEQPPIGGVGNVTVVDAATRTVLRSIGVGAGPRGILFDPVSGHLFVANQGSRSVTVLDPVTNQTLATIPIPAGLGPLPATAYELALAPALDMVYISSGPSNASVAVLNASSNVLVASVATLGSPEGMAFVPSTSEMFVADTAAANVSVINSSLGTVVANISVGVAPTGVAFDPANGLVYVTDSGSGTVDVIDPVTRAVVAQIPVGRAPTAIAFDSGSSDLAIADPFQGTVAILGPPPPTYPVLFSESGLNLTGSSWTVRVDGRSFSSSNSSILVPETTGNHRFVVPSQPPLYPTPSSGQFLVIGPGRVVAVEFAPLSYNVTFAERGLPGGTVWWVFLGSILENTSTSEIVFPEPNGSYRFVAGTDALFDPTPSSAAGTVVVSGPPSVPLVVDFQARPPYNITFVETGLPTGTNWSVSIQGITATGPESRLVFYAYSGTYSYSVPPVGSLRASPSFGTTVVSGSSPAPIPISFAPPAPPRYAVSFQVVGLPTGSVWSVIFNGAELNGSSDLVGAAPNGTYPFEVIPPPGYAAVPDNGVVTIAGHPVAVPIDLSVGVQRNGASLPFVGPWGFAILLAALAAVGVLLLFRTRRRRVIEGELIRVGHGGTAPDPLEAGAPAEGEVEELPPSEDPPGPGPDEP